MVSTALLSLIPARFTRLVVGPEWRPVLSVSLFICPGSQASVIVQSRFTVWLLTQPFLVVGALWKGLASNQRPPELQSGALPTELPFPKNQSRNPQSLGLRQLS